MREGTREIKMDKSMFCALISMFCGPNKLGEKVDLYDRLSNSDYREELNKVQEFVTDKTKSHYDWRFVGAAGPIAAGLLLPFPQKVIWNIATRPSKKMRKRFVAEAYKEYIEKYSMVKCAYEEEQDADLERRKHLKLMRDLLSSMIDEMEKYLELV